MSINFFKSTCQSQTNQYKFGLCDDPNEDPAYIDTDIDDCSKWIATVENNQEIEVIFTAIDNCIEILRSNGEKENRCDGMLTYNNHIIFKLYNNSRRRGIQIQTNNYTHTKFGMQNMHTHCQSTI